jgi:hypothetical protein
MDDVIMLKTIVINMRYVRQMRFDGVDGEAHATLLVDQMIDVPSRYPLPSGKTAFTPSACAEFWGDDARALKRYVESNPNIQRLI